MKKNISKIPLNFFKSSNVVIDFGVTVISNVVVGGLIGYYLDKWTFRNKILLVVFLFLGTIAGMYNGMRVLLKEAEKAEKTEKEKEEKKDEEKR
ncbi:AtpZ/AtpI family protein [Mesoaciditoga lauensis]|uniref:AtpZ/AtpI family protein n=1 Tax=Mesoaciditoga lauensis TaxID=1495039 RepID=UPI000569B185|nr:AtpZ/AtpI family protein [Mesoaciditoga lauensis]